MNTIDILKEKDIKITKGRIDIYNILINVENGITADYIYMECKKQKKNLNLSTIYRTLELFQEKDLIEKFDLGEGKNSYSIKKNFHKHKLECNICHKEIEVPCPMHQIEEMLKNQTGFKLTEHKLVLKGLCKDCDDK
ncbi:Fur family transcriptional regulator [Clostridium tarantellae]|uniref:Transcriptional repressor n=1 Tax=Clostridium tarantellae TaxID=39493 RepID=A0A6I1MPI9_9CLOT|nr:Fur family transcriptional regulator [Clostridium tarantellae]MPQ44047.1 transcriptional repressor [Clostridium tarantellae]